MEAWCGCSIRVTKKRPSCWWCRLCPSDVGGCENPEWAWWSGGAFVHEVGIRLVIFGVSVCGAPRFLAGVVGGGEECL